VKAEEPGLEMPNLAADSSTKLKGAPDTAAKNDQIPAEEKKEEEKKEDNVPAVELDVDLDTPEKKVSEEEMESD